MLELESVSSNFGGLQSEDITPYSRPQANPSTTSLEMDMPLM